MKKVYIANFGRKNYEWPKCLKKNTVATMNNLDAHAAWLNNDRDAYHQISMRPSNFLDNKPPTPAVTTRWFNATTTVNDTAGDIWMHCDQNHLWWTESTAAACEIYQMTEPVEIGARPIFVYHKPCLPWSSTNKKGRSLSWKSLHPKARQILFTQGTLAALSLENAGYARALIDDADLSKWHDLPKWKEVLLNSKKTLGSSFTPLERTCYRMAQTALSTAAHSNGQVVVSTLKNKLMSLSLDDMRELLAELFIAQEGLCALTDIPLQLDGEQDDDEFLCSLDRIDSDGHYDRDNVQVVCRFVNRWKSDGDNDAFKQLVDAIRRH
ncbi:hypothetical protein [Pseudomonas sp. 18175]|uniref:hypothetical protein n=1 Tax=Pseudomonas sp. 18175 TaxID=3390056 RepID=UPI003D1F23F2